MIRPDLYKKYPGIGIVPLHLSLRSFFQSILAGCFVCRWTWARLLQGPELPYHDPIFLEDSKRAIPSTIKEFRTKFSELADVYTNRLRASNPHHSGGYAIPKAVSLAVIWSIQHLLYPFVKYNTGLFLYRKMIGSRDWYDEIRRRSGMWIWLDGYGNHYKKQSSGSIAVNFNNSFLSAIGIWPVTPGTSESISVLYTQLKVSGASTVDATHLWRCWLNTCLENHTDCQASKQQMQSFRPTRLVRLLQDDQGVISTWRLDCKSAVNNADAVPYLTLSHCWGVSQPTRLTKGNLPIFQESSPTAELPKTYQHALATTQSLGFSYIWIDSLCIIQDDEEDWRAESMLMGTIYSHAACNISANWATGDTQGYFSNSDPATKAPTFFMPNHLKGSSTVQYQIGQASSYKVEIQQAPLNKRGWVIQERYLARRQLSFAKRQTYWECRQLVASEEFPLGLPQSLEVSKPHLEFEKGTDMRTIWVELVEFYSACDLSQKTDKLVALNGLVERLENITHDECISGLWRKDLCKQLCWEIYDDDEREELYQPMIPRHVAPTWSWANVDGRVVYDKAYSDHVYDICIPWVEVVESSTGKLVLRGVAIRGLVETIGPNTRNEFVNVQLTNITRLASSLNHITIHIHWDKTLALTDSDPAALSAVREQRNSDLLFLVVRGKQLGPVGVYCEGLVLRKSRCSKAGGEGHVRMGIWGTSGINPSLSGELAARLGIPIEDHFKPECLDDPRIADMVQTVTTV